MWKVHSKHKKTYDLRSNKNFWKRMHKELIPKKDSEAWSATVHGVVKSQAQT